MYGRQKHRQVTPFCKDSFFVELGRFVENRLLARNASAKIQTNA
jgi:hypothetical protein